MPPPHAAKRGRSSGPGDRRPGGGFRSSSSSGGSAQRRPGPGRGRGGGRGSDRGGGGRGGGRRPPHQHGGGADHDRRPRSSFTGGAASSSSSANPRKSGALHLKKEKTKFHQSKFREERGKQQEQHGFSGASGHAGAGARASRTPSSHRTKEVDIHLAAKMAADLRDSITLFKTRRANQEAFGKELNERFFKFVPPQLIQQHMPDAVAAFRTYLPKFEKGAPTMVSAFASWYEWASFEANKGKSFTKPLNSFGRPEAEKVDEEEEPAETKEEKDTGDAAKGEGKKKMSQTRQVMSQTLHEREHMRALLHMCLRHNAERRKQGQHAFLNHLIAKLSEDDVDTRSLERLRGTGHHSVLYALSRLLLGMVTEDFAMLCLHCHTLYLVLSQTSITAAVLLELMDEEFVLSSRMKAVKLRLEARARRGIRKSGDGNEAGAAHNEEEDDEEDNGIDPDDINDPTRGERNQRLMATVFALGAVVAANKTLKPAEAAQLTTCLSFAYVEQKVTRVLSANVLFEVLAEHNGIYQQDEPVQWMTFAFFHYPKMEYFRPEAIQLLLRLMEASPAPQPGSLPTSVEHYLTLDPLSPSTMEQISNALFRKEQVTAYHPMVHPVWDDIFQLVVRRCAMGESMKEHLSTVLHNMIVPYRRGSADIPRRALFQNLVAKLGQIAVQSDDAEQRMEVLRLASTHVGYGKRTAAKPSTMQELKLLPISGIHHKVDDLLRQYAMIHDRDPAAVTNRTWVLRELRNCLYVPVREGVEHAYVDAAVMKLLEFGFCPAHTSRDSLSLNRCIYLFADVFSFTFTAPLARPKSTVPATNIIRAYLKAEEKSKTRYTTAVQHSAFRKARNRIVEAIEGATEKRSVLFYDRGDMEIFLTLLFLVVSVDDPTNSDATLMAKSVIPDIAHFYTAGTVETLDIFLDALMAILMRVSAPLHVMPLMSCIRRIATGFVLKFAKFIRTRSSLDILLAPLRDAYHTDSREQARQRKAKQAAEADGANSSDEDVDEDEAAAPASDMDEEQGDQDDDNSSVGQAEESGSESSSDAATESDSDEEDEDDATDADTADEDEEAAAGGDGATDEDNNSDSDDDSNGDGDDDVFEEEEAPTQQYIDALKGMVGNMDLEHMYPTDTANQEKADVVRAIRLVTRVGLALRSPIVVHIYQVLLAVARENVKAADDVVFVAAISAMEMLLMTKNRYFGSFVQAADLFQLLGDIQSYLRKLSRVLVNKDSVMAKAAAVARRRLSTVKAVALRTFHFVAMLAYKNHAGEDVRITVGEYYKSVFCDRGWDTKKLLPGLKKDLYHYRQGFAWVLLPAVFEKCEEVVPLEGPQRVRVFTACCTFVESMLSRLSGLPLELKRSASAAIRSFLQSFTVAQVFEMKHTLPYNYLHAVKMVLQYNTRVQIDTAWVATVVVTPAVDDDDILLSAASIRLLSTMERMLGLTPRARETKAPSPVKVLYQQFAKQGAKEKSDFYRRAKKVRGRILKALLAHRNDDPTDEERAVKRRRKEELKIEDRVQRQVLRSARTKALTKEEREEKRKHIMMAKQERIAKNRERKRRLHEARLRSFEKWRETKLVAASQLDDDDE